MTSCFNSAVQNINKIEKIINEIDSSINDNNVNFDIIVTLIDNLFIFSNDILEISNENINLDEYNEKLNKLLLAFEEKDYILFNDILQYEFKPVLEFWKENIN